MAVLLARFYERRRRRQIRRVAKLLVELDAAGCRSRRLGGSIRLTAR